MDIIMHAYQSVLIVTFRSDNINDTLEKWHNKTAAAYQFTGMLLPNL